MRNFYKRFFSKDPAPTYPDSTDYTHSNSIYDQNVGITHVFVPYPDGHYRIASDVEICMTNDPSVTSLFSEEYRSNLKNSILSKPHNRISNVTPSDEPVLGSVVPHNLERDELAERILVHQSDFHRQAVDIVSDYLDSRQSKPQPQPTQSQP